MIAKLTLRQEDRRDLHFFVQAGRGSILPQMLQLSKDWHSQRDQGTITKSLRENMFQSVFEELANRAAKLPFGSNDYELIQALQTKQILTSTNAWNYMQWDPSAKTLKAATRDPLSSEQASTLIQKIHKLAAQSDLTHRFGCGHGGPMEIGPLPERTSCSGTPQIPNEVDGQWFQLILVRLRPSTLQRSPSAQATASRLKR